MGSGDPTLVLMLVSGITLPAELSLSIPWSLWRQRMDEEVLLWPLQGLSQIHMKTCT